MMYHHKNGLHLLDSCSCSQQCSQQAGHCCANDFFFFFFLLAIVVQMIPLTKTSFIVLSLVSFSLLQSSTRAHKQTNNIYIYIYTHTSSPSLSIVKFKIFLKKKKIKQFFFFSYLRLVKVQTLALLLLIGYLPFPLYRRNYFSLITIFKKSYQNMLLIFIQR